MMVNLFIINMKEQENIFPKLVYIIQDNLKMVLEMEKEYYTIQMGILNMMENLLIINMKEKEKKFLKMV